jgi:hypothetical protein
MRNSIGEMQDQLLRKMEKDGRKVVKVKELTLKEQIDNMNADMSLTLMERLIQMEWSEWCEYMAAKLSDDFNVARRSHIENIMRKYRTQFEKLHLSGASPRDLVAFIEDNYPDN